MMRKTNLQSFMDRATKSEPDLPSSSFMARAKKSDDHHQRIKPYYPRDEDSYKLGKVIGRGVSSVVHKAICILDFSVVAIKVIDLRKTCAEDLRRRRLRARRHTNHLDHPNLLRPHCSFRVDDASLWIVMPFMLAGSLQSIIASSYPDGLPEPCIAAVLKGVLTALVYIHGESDLPHGDIKASKILIDSSNCSVKLADSSMSSGSLFTMTGTPYWMPPEVVANDIWSFGVTALELAHGRAPLSNSPSKNVSKISQCFKHMVGLCLDLDPSKRPTAEILLTHPFFQNCKGIHVLEMNMLPEDERIDRLVRKNCDEIRGWKFDEERFVLDDDDDDDDEDDDDDDEAESNSDAEMTTEEMMKELVNLEKELETHVKWFDSIMMQLQR